MNKATSTPVLGKPATPTLTEKTGTASDSYKNAFWNSIRNRNWIDVNNDLHIGTDAEGGYLVPDEFERKLIEALEEESIFRQMATVIKTSNGDRKIPIVTSKGEAVWMDEEQQYTLSDDTFGQASLSAYKLGTAIKISEELLNDSVFDLPSYIAREFARRIGAKEEEAFFVGDGKGKPTGIFNATGGAEDGVTAASASITFDDVMELFYSLRSPYRKKAVWVLNDSTVKALRKLKDNTGNYIWNPSVQAGVVVSEGITAVGEYAFQYCNNLKTAILPTTLKTIKRNSFMPHIDEYMVHQNLYGLTEITIPPKVTEIAKFAFSGTAIKSVTIPASVSVVGEMAFSECQKLETVRYSGKIISDRMFVRCIKLKNFTITKSTTEIVGGCFNYCESLTLITYEGTISEWNSITKHTNWDGHTVGTIETPLTKIQCLDGYMEYVNGEWREVHD